MKKTTHKHQNYLSLQRFSPIKIDRKVVFDPWSAATCKDCVYSAKSFIVREAVCDLCAKILHELFNSKNILKKPSACFCRKNHTLIFISN